MLINLGFCNAISNNRIIPMLVMTNVSFATEVRLSA